MVAGLMKETFITTMTPCRPTVSAILFAPAVLAADTQNTPSQEARNMDTKIWPYSIMRVHLIVFIVRTIILKQKHFPSMQTFELHGHLFKRVSGM